MHAEGSARHAGTRVLSIAGPGNGEPLLLQRWKAFDKTFVVGQFDLDDPLDVVLGMALIRYRPGVDRYDA